MGLTVLGSDLPRNGRLRKGKVAMVRGVALLVYVLLLVAHMDWLREARAAEGTLYVCAQTGNAELLATEFTNGVIDVPAGAAFDYAGHAFNGITDPMDWTHASDNSTSEELWPGLPAKENERRQRLIQEDRKIILKDTISSGLITLAPTRLTRNRPCASVPAAVAIYEERGWQYPIVSEDKNLYYQACCLVQYGRLRWLLSDDAGSYERAANVGAINGAVRGTITRQIRVQSMETP